MYFQIHKYILKCVIQNILIYFRIYFKLYISGCAFQNILIYLRLYILKYISEFENIFWTAYFWRVKLEIQVLWGAGSTYGGTEWIYKGAYCNDLVKLYIGLSSNGATHIF